MTPDQKIRLVADALGADPASLAPSAALAGLEEWDSLGTIAVIAMLDKRFDHQLAPQEIKSLVTVQNILDLMERP